MDLSSYVHKKKLLCNLFTLLSRTHDTSLHYTCTLLYGTNGAARECQGRSACPKHECGREEGKEEACPEALSTWSRSRKPNGPALRAEETLKRTDDRSGCACGRDRR